MLANVRPAGKYLMEDFYYAGACPRCSLRSAISSTASSRREPADARRQSPARRRERRRDPPAVEPGCGAGRASRSGAATSRLTRPSSPPAWKRRLQKHVGRAVVFKSTTTWRNGSTTRRLDFDADSVIVLQNAGPRRTGECRVGTAAVSRRSSSRRACATCCASRMRA